MVLIGLVFQHTITESYFKASIRVFQAKILNYYHVQHNYVTNPIKNLRGVVKVKLD